MLSALRQPIKQESLVNSLYLYKLSNKQFKAQNNIPGDELANAGHEWSKFLCKVHVTY